MKVFCPNCGTENEGMPGGRLTCKACTASFEVPREGGVVAPPPPQVIAPPPPVIQAPPPSSSPFPTGYVGPPPSGFGQGGQGGGGLASGSTNTLAIVSMVLGILCCIPFASTAAIVTGVIATNQINASHGAQRGREFALVGIIMGSLGVVLGIVGMLFNVLGKLH
jgi:hypothetical protein